MSLRPFAKSEGGIKGGEGGVDLYPLSLEAQLRVRALRGNFVRPNDFGYKVSGIKHETVLRLRTHIDTPKRQPLVVCRILGLVSWFSSILNGKQ